MCVCVCVALLYVRKAVWALQVFIRLFMQIPTMSRTIKHSSCVGSNYLKQNFPCMPSTCYFFSFFPFSSFGVGVEGVKSSPISNMAQLFLLLISQVLPSLAVRTENQF